MSTLKQKVSTHLDQLFPPEYDEAWVDTLLTDNDNSTIELLKKIKQERQSQAKKIEPRARKLAPNQQSADTKNKAIGPSAIQKQIEAYQRAKNTENNCC